MIDERSARIAREALGYIELAKLAKEMGLDNREMRRLAIETLEEDLRRNFMADSDKRFTRLTDVVS